MSKPTSTLFLAIVTFCTAMLALAALLLVPFGLGRAASGAAGRSAVPQRSFALARSGDGLVEMTVQDVIPIPAAQTHAVMLVSKDHQVVLPVFVDEESAIAIAFRLANRKAPRSLSADLLDRLVVNLGGKVVEVRIDDVDAHLYEGRVFIDQAGKHLQVSAAPSDSIAMALSTGAPIFVAQKVTASAGITQEDLEALQQSPGVGGSEAPPEEGEETPEAPVPPVGNGPPITL